MKALLSGVLCAGLFGQATVWAAANTPAGTPEDAVMATSGSATDTATEPAEPMALGHVSVGWQQDDADGEGRSLAFALPVSAHWTLSASQADSDTEWLGRDGVEQGTSRSRRLGAEYSGAEHDFSLSRLAFDDDAVLETEETRLQWMYRGDGIEFGLELAQRRHEVTVELFDRTRQEQFDSRGIGVRLGVQADNGNRLYGGWQQYSYDEARVLDPNFGNRLLDYPRLYNLLLTQRDQAEGALVDHNAWVGIDLPIAEHLLNYEHNRSELEVDGSQFHSDTVTLALTFAAHWALDLSIGQSRGDAVDAIQFTGVAVHFFW